MGATAKEQVPLLKGFWPTNFQMNVHHLLIDDRNPLHRELSIYRTGTVNQVRLRDRSYHVYGSLSIDAHDYAALFHYHIIEACNALPFLSESGNGLDSWDEALLHQTNFGTFLTILSREAGAIDTEKEETVVLGWQNHPEPVMYLRRIDPLKTLAFIDTLKLFVETSLEETFDLEFIL